jgi:hypothetical protein
MQYRQHISKIKRSSGSTYVQRRQCIRQTYMQHRWDGNTAHDNCCFCVKLPSGTDFGVAAIICASRCRQMTQHDATQYSLSASPVGEARCRCRKVWLTRIDYMNILLRTKKAVQPPVLLQSHLSAWIE